MRMIVVGIQEMFNERMGGEGRVYMNTSPFKWNTAMF